jgi:LmbE family N-acetylglucosaminyl deacetylase
VAGVTDRSLFGLGTDESVWLGCAELGHLDGGPVVLPDSGRVVVVVPHPDVEVLGGRGATAALVGLGARVVLVAVTRGEASTPEGAEELRSVRPCESSSAAARRGTTPSVVRSPRLPDGRVRLRDVEAPLVSLLRPGDLVLAPWAHDGHPDHDEVGLAAERVCEGAEAPLWASLVRAWHWAQPSEFPWDKARRIELDDAMARRKREAMECFTSQITGPEPILSSGTVRRLRRDSEVFVAP